MAVTACSPAASGPGVSARLPGGALCPKQAPAVGRRGTRTGLGTRSGTLVSLLLASERNRKVPNLGRFTPRRDAPLPRTFSRPRRPCSDTAGDEAIGAETRGGGRQEPRAPHGDGEAPAAPSWRPGGRGHCPGTRPWGREAELSSGHSLTSAAGGKNSESPGGGLPRGTRGARGASGPCEVKEQPQTCPRCRRRARWQPVTDCLLRVLQSSALSLRIGQSEHVRGTEPCHLTETVQLWSTRPPVSHLGEPLPDTPRPHTAHGHRTVCADGVSRPTAGPTVLRGAGEMGRGLETRGHTQGRASRRSLSPLPFYVKTCSDLNPTKYMWKRWSTRISQNAK